jgi:hypothetical protein
VSGPRELAAAEPRVRPATHVARVSWIATHGPSLVVVWAILAIALLSGARAEDPDATGGLSALLEHGGIGAVLGALATWLSSYSARRTQAVRMERRAMEAAARTAQTSARAHDTAYGALDTAMRGLRGELESIRTALDVARAEATEARAEAERMRTELDRAEDELHRLRGILRDTTRAVRTLDARTRAPGEASVTPAEGVRLDDSDPG